MIRFLPKAVGSSCVTGFTVGQVEGEHFVTIRQPGSFVAFVACERLQLVTFYPQDRNGTDAAAGTEPQVAK